jgi:peroxiredoxin
MGRSQKRYGPAIARRISRYRIRTVASSATADCSIASRSWSRSYAARGADELSELRQAYPRIRAAGGRLVAIAPQTPDAGRDFFADSPFPFPILIDRESRTAAWFGLSYEVPERVREVYRNALGLDLAEINDDAGWHLPMTARYIIDRGVIVYARVDPDPCVRPEPDDTIAFLEDLLR